MFIGRSRTHSPSAIRPSEITPKSVYLARRHFLTLGAGSLAAAALSAKSALAATFSGLPHSNWAGDEKVNSLTEITSYNNFYEFGLSKEDPKTYAGTLKTKPWAVTVEGECAKPGTIALEDLIRPPELEERIYRLRCVEAWSMVIPWVGVPLSKVLARFEPNSKAKFVAFETILAPDQLPGQRSRVLEWPYREGLRIDEAMHPLTLLAVGLYGEPLPQQNGAPLRLVVPWKYGFKSIKSIVRIRFQETMPQTTWAMANPDEYGFYSNVNPVVDHPRWTQSKERRIGEFLRRPTQMFNGYGEQVASLYGGMDLVRNF